MKKARAPRSCRRCKSSRPSSTAAPPALFAVGRFHDTVKLNGAAPKLARRMVRLETRLLGYGYHIPF